MPNLTSRVMAGAALLACIAVPAGAQSLPAELTGRWDISTEACDTPGTSQSQVDITALRIDTFGGIAEVREVKRTGPVVFVAADFQQLEGVETVPAPSREYFRFEQRIGPDRLRMIWKDVQTTDLVRCGAAPTDSSAPSPAPDDQASYDGRLPLPLGLWVLSDLETGCQNPPNAAWRVYDGIGLRGAASRRCEIDSTQFQADGILFSQLCEASYNGAVEATRDFIRVTAPRSFTLVEGADGSAGQDFDWCGPALAP